MARSKFTSNNLALTAAGQRPAGGGDVLFGTSADFPRLIEVEVDHIEPNPNQPRRNFDAGDLEALAQSIERYGLKQPILVREIEGKPGAYLLVAGERRWRAHRLLDRETIFAVITTGNVDELSLVENMQRADLNVVEQARGMAGLIEVHGYTQEEVGKIVGLSRADVAGALSVLRLPDDIIREYEAAPETITRSALIAVAAAPESSRAALWKRAAAGATVAELREIKRDTKARVDGGGQDLRILGQGLLQIGRGIERVVSAKNHLAPEHRKALTDLRARITALLGD